MSSPVASVHSRSGGTNRVPRRKRRDELDSLRQPRKRSKLSEDAFRAVEDGQTNGHAEINGIGDRRVSNSRLQMVVRDKRHSSGSFRNSRPEGGTTLTKTAEYTVKLLPGLPDKLKEASRANYRPFLQSTSASMHSAVVTTNNSVLIWDYNTTTPSPVPRIVNLPVRLKPTDKLPLASLVTTGTSSDAGLVVVYPSSGNIYYWENVDTTESISLFMRSRNGIEGHIKLMSGELIDSLVQVEHGGYILVLSSGRLAYVTLQDQASRPTVAVSLLSNDGRSNGSWFGSLKATLGGGWRNTVVGVRTRAQNNRFEVVALTHECMLKLWDVEYSGSASFKNQIDVSAALQSTFIQAGFIGEDSKAPVKIIDFALAKQSSNALVTKGSTSGLDLIILASYEGSSRQQFVLVHLTTSNSEAEVTRLTPIHCFSAPLEGVETKYIKLTIPSPGHTALITMANATIVASLEKILENPKDELTAPPYQDVIYFQHERGQEIEVFTPEIHAPSAKSEASSMVIYTTNAGLVRIIAEKPSKDPKRQRLFAKDKIEQAVFFGHIAAPVLDLQSSSDFNFPIKEVEAATLKLSHEILTSSNTHVPDGSSLGSQIHWRLAHIKRLAAFVISKWSSISRETRWRLLWDTEKLESAYALWKVYEKWLSEKHSEEKILFPLFIAAIGDKSRGESDPNAGENDPVRYWFLHDVDRVDKILDKLEMVMLEEYNLNKGKGGYSIVAQYIRESQDVVVALMQTAYDFRQKNLALYKLENEKLEHGILTSGYEDLPEPWTARKNNVTRVSSLASYLCPLLSKLNEIASQEKSNLGSETMSELQGEEWKLVYISCLQHAERSRWLLLRADEEERANGQRLKFEFKNKIRPDLLLGLADLGHGTDGMMIAEKLHDMDGLVQLCVAEIELLTNPDRRIGSEAVYETRKEEFYVRLEKYFDKYGESFSQNFFTAQIQHGRLADLLQDDFNKQKALTQFLRKNPEHWKLSWINEITKEKDFLMAGETLLKIAKDKEPNIWVKNAEISLAKLALLGSATVDDRKPKEAAVGEYAAQLTQRVDNEKAKTKIHQQLYAHMKPALMQGVDHEGAVELAMQTFGLQAVHDRDNLKTLLHNGFSELARHRTVDPEVLIDVLTLMDSMESGDARRNIAGREFLMAVKVLQSSGYCEGRETAKGDYLRGLIWKRLFVRDDWKAIHQTKGKRDKDVEDALKGTMLFNTLKAGAAEGLWDTTPATTIPKPSNVIGAGSSPKDLEYRFGADLAAPIAADNAKDDTLLSDYLSRCRIGFHFDACRDLAVKAAEEEKETKENIERRRQEVLREMREPESLGRGLVEGAWDIEVHGDEEGEGEGMDIDE